MSTAALSQKQTCLHQRRLYAVDEFDPLTSTMPCGHWARAFGRDDVRLHAALNVDVKSSALSQHAVVTLHAVLALVAHHRVYWSLLLQQASTLTMQQRFHDSTKLHNIETTYKVYQLSTRDGPNVRL